MLTMRLMARACPFHALFSLDVRCSALAIAMMIVTFLRFRRWLIHHVGCMLPM
jgi:hypothetical protein